MITPGAIWVMRWPGGAKFRASLYQLRRAAKRCLFKRREDIVELLAFGAKNLL
jgi:hypothetical protein